MNVGNLAEELVAAWLTQQGGHILERRWHCRWGELDLVAQCSNTLAFVEVKARSRGNWDADGLLSITAQKQAKLWKAAECFLSDYPDLAELPCRFDVALVNVRSVPVSKTAILSSKDLIPPENLIKEKITFKRAIVLNGYQLTLIEYLEAAFC